MMLCFSVVDNIREIPVLSHQTSQLTRHVEENRPPGNVPLTSTHQEAPHAEAHITSHGHNDTRSTVVSSTVTDVDSEPRPPVQTEITPAPQPAQLKKWSVAQPKTWSDNQCWLNADPALQTVGQQSSNIGITQMSNMMNFLPTSDSEDSFMLPNKKTKHKIKPKNCITNAAIDASDSSAAPPGECGWQQVELLPPQAFLKRGDGTLIEESGVDVGDWLNGHAASPRASTGPVHSSPGGATQRSSPGRVTHHSPPAGPPDRHAVGRDVLMMTPAEEIVMIRQQLQEYQQAKTKLK